MIDFSNRHPDIPFSTPSEFRSWIKSVLELEGKQEGLIQYVFMTDDLLLALNRSFLSHDTYTDIITFPTTDHPNIVSGEIYVSLDRVQENAKQMSQAFQRELSRVCIHGILHLIGYDDHSEEEKQVMRFKEDYYLSLQPKKY